MPYADPQTRRDKRRDYMREFMRRKRAGGISTEKAVSSPTSVSSPEAVSSPQFVSTPAGVSSLTPVSTKSAVSAGYQPGNRTKPHIVFRPAVYPPTGLTPVVRSMGKKVYRLFTDGVTAAERNAARLRLHEIAAKAGVPVGDLMAAIGAPPDALDVPHA